MRYALLLYASLLLTFLCGCQADPCADALENAGGIESPNLSRLQIPIIERTNTVGRRGNSLRCVNTVLVDSENYADTVHSGNLWVRNDLLVISDLRPGKVDIILDLEELLPVKINDLSLKEGENVYPKKILMYRYDVPFAIPGEIGIVLKSGVELRQISSIYTSHGSVKVFREPGGYQLRLPFCVFRGIEATDSKGSKTVIPTHRGQRFRSIEDTFHLLS